MRELRPESWCSFPKVIQHLWGKEQAFRFTSESKLVCFLEGRAASDFISANVLVQLEKFAVSKSNSTNTTGKLIVYGGGGSSPAEGE